MCTSLSAARTGINTRCWIALSSLVVFPLVPISMLTAVLILHACNAANTERGRGGQSYVSVAWEVLQVFSEELGGKMNCA